MFSTGVYSNAWHYAKQTGPISSLNCWLGLPMSKGATSLIGSLCFCLVSIAMTVLCQLPSWFCLRKQTNKQTNVSTWMKYSLTFWLLSWVSIFGVDKLCYWVVSSSLALDSSCHLYRHTLHPSSTRVGLSFEALPAWNSMSLSPISLIESFLFQANELRQWYVMFW